MPTEAQLQAEPWWNREVITPELDWLGDEICRRTGRPRTAAGTKGDRFHLNGAHRSQEWILKSTYCTSRTYTVQPNLTAEQLRQIAGFDFTPALVEQMIAQSKRLMAALRAGRLEGVREFYGNVNGDRWVDGWDNLRNLPATSDDSHLWHWHLSIDRRKLRDKALMQRILATALGTEEEDMPTAQEIAKATNDEWDRRHGKVRKLTGDANTMQDVDAAIGWIHKNGYDTRTAVLGTLVPVQAAILAAVSASTGLTEAQLTAAVAQGVRQALPDWGEVAQTVAGLVDHDLDVAAVAQGLREFYGDALASVDES